MGQIEVADVTNDFAENKTATDDNEKAVDWLESNGYCYAKDEEATHDVNCTISIK